MLPSFCTETVTIERAPLETVRGSAVRDWTKAQPHTISGCSVQPASTSSNEERAEQVTDRWELYAPPGADIETGDRVMWSGHTFDIDGAPYQWASPTGRVTHLHAHLVRWEG